MEKKRAKVTLHKQIKEKQRMVVQLVTGQQEEEMAVILHNNTKGTTRENICFIDKNKFRTIFRNFAYI